MGNSNIKLQKDVVTTYYKLEIDGKQTNYVADITAEYDEKGTPRAGRKVLWGISIVKPGVFEFYNLITGYCETLEQAHEQIIQAALKL